MNANIKEIQTQIDLDASHLMQLNNIVKLAAFAAESRRALVDYSWVLKLHPETEASIHEMVKQSSQWAEQEDVLAEVLTDTANKIEALANRFERHSMAMKGGAQ